MMMTQVTPQSPQTVQIHSSVATAQPQPADRIRKVLKSLGAAEVALGCTSLLIGIVICSYIGETGAFRQRSKDYYSSYSIIYTYDYPVSVTVGEGIWCGVWFIIAGSLGIATGSKSTNHCLISTHMNFSIIGIIASALLIIIAGNYAAVNASDGFMLGYKIFLVIIGLSGFILHIMSIVYCRKADPGSCGGCCDEYQTTTVQPGVVVTTANQPLPVSMAHPVQTQGYVVPQQHVMQPATVFVQHAPSTSVNQGFQGTPEKVSIGQNLSGGGASSASPSRAVFPPYTMQQ